MSVQVSSKLSFREEVLAGLGKAEKTLPCKFFYDARGSQLFEEICELEEYYPTRTELTIMEAHGPQMADEIGPRASVIEYGSGSSRKTRVLLDALEKPAVYVPIDISRETLLESAEAISKQYPDLEVFPVSADYLSPIALPEGLSEDGQRVVYFPGSTIGNFVPDDARAFLSRMVEQAGPEGSVLIGVDLKKDVKTLERAYDDEAGVTARFNRNLLARINRELGADFAVESFVHEARWNPEEGRVEMHLVASEACEVEIGEERIHFGPGESIHTESSYKYEIAEFEELAHSAGLVRRACWTDPQNLFGILYFEVADGAR
jgi:L-histidine N-alpha-methyltransferase